MLRINVGGATILGRPEGLLARVEGLFVGPDGFHGWDDGVDVRREAVDRPAQHGEFDLPAYNGSRVIAIDGHALAWSETDLAVLRNRVMGICADGKERLSIEHQGEKLWADVRRGAKPTFTDSGIRYGMLRARFALFLVAADPRKFGTVRIFAAGEPAIHRGNFPAAPVFTITGPQPAYTITAGSRQFVVDVALPSGSTDVIDMSTGWVRRNGTVLVDGVSRAQTWTIPPGPTGVSHTFSGTASRFSVAVADEYM